MPRDFEKVVRSRTHPSAVSVTTTAAVATATDLNRAGVLFQNVHATEAIYLGNSGVTSANGYRLAAGAEFFDGQSSAEWYCRTAAGTSDLRLVIFY